MANPSPKASTTSMPNQCGNLCEHTDPLDTAWSWLLLQQGPAALGTPAPQQQYIHECC
jgi:hypothetical protein